MNKHTNHVGGKGRPRKTALPFRLGCTSYVYPDEILPNIRRMAPLVDDFELILFESNDMGNIPAKKEIDELCLLARDYDLSYTIHLPTDLILGASDRDMRERMLTTIHKIADAVAPLSPYAYVLHCEGIEKGASEEKKKKWQSHCREGIEWIVHNAISDPRLLCIENLGYPWQWHAGFSADAGCALCCDIGHLLSEKSDGWLEQLETMLPLTRVVHLHGVSAIRDHQSLCHEKDSTVRRILSMLRSYRHVVTLEVFSPHDVYGSLNMIRRLWDRSF